MASLDTIKADASALSPWAHLATVGSDGERRLWNGVFDYDLNLFSPGGPDGSPNTVFVAVQPERAVSLKAYGLGGRNAWAAEAGEG